MKPPDAAAAAPLSATGRRAWTGDDFPSWMSPMLVKELRQGVQSGVFAWTFVLLQAAMFILMLLWLLDRSRSFAGPDGGFFHGTFWWLFGIAAVLAIPLRAGATMVSERQGQTLDLLRLTRLSSTQIVVGKWLSTMAQVGLLAVAVLPYVVLQYFFGGLDVVADLSLFVMVLLGASVVTALSIATSGQPAAARGLLVAVFVYGFFVFNSMGGVFVGGLVSPAAWTAIAIVTAILSAVLLEYGAAGIAPAAENHAGRIRALVLLAAMLSLGATWMAGPVTVGVIALFTLVMAIGVGAAELTTDPVTVTSVHARFARFGPAGRLAGLFLAPGWATGVLFLLLATGLGALAEVIAAGAGANRDTLPIIALAAASVLFPLPLMLFFSPGRKRGTAFVLTGAVSMAIYVLGRSWWAAYGTGTWSNPHNEIIPFLPLPAFFQAIFGSTATSPGLNVALPLLVTALALSMVAPRWLREMGALVARLREAARQPAGRRAARQ